MLFCISVLISPQGGPGEELIGQPVLVSRIVIPYGRETGTIVGPFTFWLLSISDLLVQLISHCVLQAVTFAAGCCLSCSWLSGYVLQTALTTVWVKIWEESGTSFVLKLKLHSSSQLTVQPWILVVIRCCPRHQCLCDTVIPVCPPVLL